MHIYAYNITIKVGKEAITMHETRMLEFKETITDTFLKTVSAFSNYNGSTFTIQGFDLNYAGVILGPSVKYRNGKVIFDPSESCNEKAIRNRTLSDGTKQKFGEILIQHEVRVLMTRGVNGMYIYACDPELQKALLEAAK